MFKLKRLGIFAAAIFLAVYPFLAKAGLDGTAAQRVTSTSGCGQPTPPELLTNEIQLVARIFGVDSGHEHRVIDAFVQWFGGLSTIDATLDVIREDCTGGGGGRGIPVYTECARGRITIRKNTCEAVATSLSFRSDLKEAAVYDCDYFAGQLRTLSNKDVALLPSCSEPIKHSKHDWEVKINVQVVGYKIAN